MDNISFQDLMRKIKSLNTVQLTEIKKEINILTSVNSAQEHLLSEEEKHFLQCVFFTDELTSSINPVEQESFIATDAHQQYWTQS